MNCPICNKVLLDSLTERWWCFHILKRYGIGYANQDGGYTYITYINNYIPELRIKGFRVLNDDQIDKLMLLR